MVSVRHGGCLSEIFQVGMSGTGFFFALGIWYPALATHTWIILCLLLMCQINCRDRELFVQGFHIPGISKKIPETSSWRYTWNTFDETCFWWNVDWTYQKQSKAKNNPQRKELETEKTRTVVGRGGYDRKRRIRLCLSSFILPELNPGGLLRCLNCETEKVWFARPLSYIMNSNFPGD